MKRQTGFTLVELVIVIAVLGILAGLAIPYFMEAREEAAKKECLANRTQILRMFHAQQAVGYSSDLTTFLTEAIEETDNKYFTFAPKCAYNGIYSVSNEIVVCSIAEHNEESIIVSGGIGKDFYDKIVDALNGWEPSSQANVNGQFRDWWLSNGNNWEELNGSTTNYKGDYSNATLYLMFHMGVKSDKDPLIYANLNPDPKDPNDVGNKWQAKYVYDAHNDQWYRYKDGQGDSIAEAYKYSGSSYITEKVIGNDKWEKVTLNGDTFSK